MILYIDHYDSFTNTIVDYVSYLGFEVCVRKTDEQLNDLNKYSHIIIGPGPGHPSELKHLYSVINFCENNNKPLLGICLGHQLIAKYFGFNVIKSKAIFHGRNSLIFIENDCAIYKGLPKQFEVTRYHSLVVDSIKKPLVTIANTKEDEIMAFKHNKYNIFGVQYHPEAYLTEHGLEVLDNFLKID
ncbi:aminodeoxychorismate/anthranilate synthase component II [Francisellaceae bacterium CB299]|jgi:anthranilate synthase component II